MAAAQAVPQHKLFESPNTRSIEVNDWLITVSTNPISNATQIDEIQGYLGFPLPEMTFGNNYLDLEHRPSGWKYTFNTAAALGKVKGGELGEGDGGVKVEYADAWLKSRTNPSSQSPMPITSTTKLYDWTYTTTYQGHALSESPPQLVWTPADPLSRHHTIPLAELTRPDPILFYAEVPLFEDELHDNGASTLLVRIRVMPTCIFILSRFTLRVDNVLFRIHDTRIYHSFESSPPLVIKQTNGFEAPYAQVKAQIPRRDDLTPLTDSNFIAKILSEMPPRQSQQEGAGTKWRGLGKESEIVILKS